MIGTLSTTITTKNQPSLCSLRRTYGRFGRRITQTTEIRFSATVVRMILIDRLLWKVTKNSKAACLKYTSQTCTVWFPVASGITPTSLECIDLAPSHVRVYLYLWAMQSEYHKSCSLVAREACMCTLIWKELFAAEVRKLLICIGNTITSWKRGFENQFFWMVE